MFNVYSTEKPHLYGTLPTFTRQNDLMDLNLNKVIEMRRADAKVLSGKHPLVRLCYSLITMGDVLDVAKHVDANFNMICSAHGFVTSSNRGRVQDVWQYPHSLEYVLATRSSDLSEVEENWRDYPSLTVQYHDDNNLSMIHTRGQGTYALYRIDLMALAIQLNLYLRSQSEDETPERPRTVERFAYEVVFTNAIESHINVALMNRLMTDNPSTINGGVYFLFNVDDAVDKYHRDLEYTLKRRPTSMSRTLQGMRLFKDTTAWDLFKVPEVSESSQCRWWLRLAHLQWLQWMYLNYEIIDRPLNGEIQNEIRQWRNDKSGKMELKDIWELVEDQMSVLDDIVGWNN